MQAPKITLAILLAASIASATQFEAFDRVDQVRTSDVILLGRVSTLRSDWEPSRTGIRTDALIEVAEVWKGLPASDRIVVRTPGGSVDDVEFVVDAAARFSEGEDVLLFLSRDGDVYRPTGMIFGKYSVERAGPDAFVVGNMPPAVIGAQDYEAVSIDLNDLRQEVRAILEGDRR